MSELQRTFLITAGPTREYIDPVRYLSNRSSGRMGYALAQAANRAGHRVHLVSGSVNIEPPPGVKLHPCITAAEMYTLVADLALLADIAILSAAVADYRPTQYSDQKIKKGNNEHMTLKLERTADILGSMREPIGFSGLLVGFAAETENITENALEKLRSKRCDLLVANDVSREDIGFDSEQNAVTLFDKITTEPIQMERASKQDIARRLITYCLSRCGEP